MYFRNLLSVVLGGGSKASPKMLVYTHTYIHTYAHKIIYLYFSNTIYSVSATASNSTESLTTSNGMPVVDAYSTIDATAAANALKSAKSVVIVPGYGLAVAKAQFVIADIANVSMYICMYVCMYVNS